MLLGVEPSQPNPLELNVNTYDSRNRLVDQSNAPWRWVSSQLVTTVTRLKIFAFAVGLLALSLGSAMAQARSPKEVVTAFFDLAFVQGKATEAALSYISPVVYIQHNPMVADGRDAFLQFVPPALQASGRRSIIKRVIAEDDLVVVHASSSVPGKPDEPVRAVMDIFRVKDGLIIEHWDVVQVVPKTSANSNGMF